jgi:hypothetical protein
MKPQAILQELERAAEQLSVKVSYEVMGATVGHGGLCRVKDQYRVIIDKRASVHDRVATLAYALAQLDTKAIVLPAKARKLVDYYARPAGPQRKAS